MVPLPRYVAFKSKFNGGYLRYVKENPYIQTCMESSEESVVSPYTKFELETAKCDPSLVNIRCCYNNKYWITQSAGTGYVSIVAQADKTEEDKSKSTCTLFKPVYDGTAQAYRFCHVHLGTNLSLLKAFVPYCTYFLVSFYDPPGIGQELSDLSTIIDWETLLALPKHIAFKGDNGCYLRASWINGCEMLQFDTSDIGHPGVRMETFTTKDGSIRTRSDFFGKFWRKSDNSFILADSTDVAGTDPNTLFWPTQIDTNIIALRNLGNKNFIKRYTTSYVQNGLNACVDTIDQYSKIRIEEAVLSREIYDVQFKPSNSRIYDQSALVMATGNATNQTEVPNTVSLRLKYTNTKSSTWNASVSLKLGVKTKIETGIPFIANGQIEISVEFTGTYQWGETKTESRELETTYQVTVPPMTTLVVSLLATQGTCDVPFSYTQRDVLLNGDTVISNLDDGIYSGMNCYNFTYQTKKIPMLQKK